MCIYMYICANMHAYIVAARIHVRAVQDGAAGLNIQILSCSRVPIPVVNVRVTATCREAE